MTASPLRSGSQPPSDPAALDRWLLKREEALAETLGREITRLVQRCVRAFSDTLPALTASGDYSVFDQIPVEWADILDERLLPDIEQTYFSGGLSTWASVPAEVAISAAVAQGWAAIVNESAREFLSQRRNFLVGVGDNLFQGVIAQVDRALATGASTEDVKQSLQRLGQFSEFRADTIARTEIQTAYASGNWNASVALGEFGPVEKEWLATNDARTRDTHRELDGTVVPFSQPFTVGGAQMMHPKDQSGPASEVVNCRCILLEYWPGDPRRDGSIVPEPVALEPASTLEPVVQAEVTTEVREPVTPTLRPGPRSVRTLRETFQLPSAGKGRMAERVAAINDVADAVDAIHGSPGVMSEIEIVLGGKAGLKGGHFSPASRGPRPKRSPTMSVAEWNMKASEYNARVPRAEIRVNDFDIPKQMSDVTHELGHALDWDGQAFISTRAWQSASVRNLQGRYGRDWLDHLDEVTDEETRLLLQLGKEVRSASSVKTYLANADVAYRQYFTSIEEVWARAYSQWITEVTGDPRLLSHMRKAQAGNFQFSDEEFAQIGPIIERVLRLRGVLA